MNYIYISHAENETSVPLQLKQYLRFTFDTWCPADDVPFGSDLSTVIPQKIKEASAMLVILSEKSLNSKQLSRELHIADKYSIPLVPVVYGKFEWTEALEYYFSGLTTTDISALESDLSCLNTIIAELKKYGGRAEYDNLIDVKLEEEEVPLPAEDTSALREKVKKLSPSLQAEPAAQEPDYDNIASTEEKLSALFEVEDVNAELSLATEGPAFTRYIFNVPSHLEQETLDSLKERVALALESDNVDCYFTEEKGGVVIDVPKAEKEKFGLLPFLKNEGFLSTKAPTLIAGKDVNENCLFIDLAKAKYLLVVGDSQEAREDFLDLCYLSLKAKFSEKEMQIKLCNSVENGLEDLNEEIPAVLLLTDVKENGLYEDLNSLPENVYAIAEVEAEDVDDLSVFEHKVVFYRKKCKHHARTLTDGELIYKTKDFAVRALMPEIREEEGESILIAAEETAEDEIVITVDVPETEEVPETITEAPAEEAEEPEVEVEFTVDDVPVANVTQDIFSDDEIDVEFTVTEEEPAEVPAVEEIAEEPAEESVEEPAEEATIEEVPAEAVEEVAEEAVEEPVEEIAPASKWTKVPAEERPNDLYIRALKVFVDRNAASISILQQRPLLMNYSKAREVYLWMAEKGYISEPDELGYRKLLITAEDYAILYE